MSDSAEVDPETLRRELKGIKDAMGLQERYPSQFGLWLVYGALVLAASLASQYIHLRELPGYWHPLAWFAILSLGGIYQWRALEARSGGFGSIGAKPRIPLQFAGVFALYFVFLVGVSPAFEGLGQGRTGILIFSPTVGLVGAAYLVVGESLRAYYIRRRDRWAFYAGGAWMLALAAVMPNVAVLETWGYVAFGGLYLLHAVGSYLALS